MGVIYKIRKGNYVFDYLSFMGAPLPTARIDENGNETGDSIDLSQCDYILDDIDVYDWESLLNQQEWYPVRELKEDMFDV